jgi:hypothetical protein
MRAMDREPDSWIETPAFNWTPEVPLRVEPKFEDALPDDIENLEPRFENPAPAVEQCAPSATRASTTREQAPRFIVVTVVEPRATPLFLPRLLVGLGQGAGLSLLFASRATMDPYVFSAALMAGLFAPLLLLSGLGRARFAPLLIWTIFAGGLLAAAGGYHHWRTLSSDSGHPGLSLIALTALFLFIGQAIVESGAGDYAAHYRSAWRLAIRIVICAAVAGLAWAAAGAASGLMREQALPFSFFIIPIVTVSTALAAQLTGARLLGALQEGVVFVFGMALVFVLLLSMAMTGLGAFGIWQPSLAVTAVLGAVLILCINASYRDGTSMRPYWRRRAEFAASLVLLPLALIAAVALTARVAQHGWTDNRIFAAAWLLLMGGYALSYAASALISLGGGGWMQRIETSNLALGFAALTLLATLASPVGDPARLAVASQSYRLAQHQVTADAFDYVWLRDHGLRFGHEALSRMEASTTEPLVARGAFVALTAPPAGLRPAPTEIGANIHVQSGQALPAGLLARDWSGVAGAPPCLTNASLSCDAFFADVDGDGRSEILLAYGSDARWWASVMKQGQDSHGNMRGGWYVEGTLAAPSCPGGLTALRSGQFALVQPASKWRDLLVGGMRLSVAQPKTPMGCPLS